MKCRNTDHCSKFVPLKKFKNEPYKFKNRYYRNILLDENKRNTRSILNLKKQFFEAEIALHERTTWLKRLCIICTLSTVANKEARKLKTSLEKKFSKILKDAKNFDEIYPNPNVTITNLSSTVPENDEYKTLQYGLKHGLAIKRNDDEMFAISEDLLDFLYRYLYRFLPKAVF